MFEAGRARAAAEGVELEWREADAEALPFADGEFDVVLSGLGAMFAPHQQAAADELVRVCRPGGRFGLISWTPEGFIGQLFATMKPYAPRRRRAPPCRRSRGGRSTCGNCWGTGSPMSRRSAGR